ncbi:MAG: endonuclease III, partial [Candidatus Aenigmatarchaeota archaeon]
IKTKTPEETEAVLRKTLPKGFWNDFNNTFVTFGQNVCKPVGPKCFLCPVEKYCKYGEKNLNKRKNNTKQG